jgi:hypothetical protein
VPEAAPPSDTSALDRAALREPTSGKFDFTSTPHRRRRQEPTPAHSWPTTERQKYRCARLTWASRTSPVPERMQLAAGGPKESNMLWLRAAPPPPIFPFRGRPSMGQGRIGSQQGRRRGVEVKSTPLASAGSELKLTNTDGGAPLLLMQRPQNPPGSAVLGIPQGNGPALQVDYGRARTNTLCWDWGVTYTTAAQLSSALCRCDTTFSADISDACHLSLWAGCGGGLRPTRRPIVSTAAGEGPPRGSTPSESSMAATLPLAWVGATRT